VLTLAYSRGEGSLKAEAYLLSFIIAFTYILTSGTENVKRCNDKIKNKIFLKKYLTNKTGGDIITKLSERQQQSSWC